MTLRVRPAPFAAGILLFALLALVFSCSENPTQPTVSVPMEGEAKIDPGSGGAFLLSTVGGYPGLAGVIEVWAYNLAVESDSVVGFDLVIVNKTNGDISPPISFVITSIVPSTVECLNPDGYYRDRKPYYDFSDDLGDDGLLSAGEATDPVHARFGWPEPTAFSIGFRLVIGSVLQPGVIAGVVFADLNENGVYDRGEIGIPGVLVENSAAPVDTAASGRAMTVRTDHLGRYAFSGVPAGVYSVRVLTEPGVECTTPNPLLVALVELPDGTVSSFRAAHFGLTAPPPPRWVFGPLPVGPASPYGTGVDSTFVIPTPMPPFPPEEDRYYVRVEPPMVRGPYPIFIDRIAVAVDGQAVYRFECPPDSLCPPPFARLPIDPALMKPGEHAIAVKVSGSESSFVHVGIERGAWRETGPAGDDK